MYIYIFLKTFGNAWFSLNCLYNEMVPLQTDTETGKRKSLIHQYLTQSCANSLREKGNLIEGV